jgi:hypothetical protein
VYVERPMYAEQDARPYSELRAWCRRFYEVEPGRAVARRTPHSAPVPGEPQAFAG